MDIDNLKLLRTLKFQMNFIIQGIHLSFQNKSLSNRKSTIIKILNYNHHHNLFWVYPFSSIWHNGKVGRVGLICPWVSSSDRCGSMNSQEQPSPVLKNEGHASLDKASQKHSWFVQFPFSVCLYFPFTVNLISSLFTFEMITRHYFLPVNNNPVFLPPFI